MTSVPHSADASASLAPCTPPQLAEFISETRNVDPCVDATAASCAMRATGGASVLGPSSALANEPFLRGGVRSQVCIAYVCALKPIGRGPGRDRTSSMLSSHAAEAKP